MLRLGDYREVLGDVKANLIFTSPPYNIGSRCPRKDGQRPSGSYDPKSFGAIRDYPDALPEAEYQDQQAAFLIWCADHLTDNGVLVYNHKPRRRDLRMIHPALWMLRPEVAARLTLMEEVIWDRGSTHNHCKQLMWPQTERLYVFRKSEGRYRLNNRKYGDVWRIGLTTHTDLEHNAPFPLELAERVIELWTKAGELVCDPYAGSGTTWLAALKLGRRFKGAEVLRKYHELASKRLRYATEEVVVAA
jgi:DNA modification methylase